MLQKSRFSFSRLQVLFFSVIILFCLHIYPVYQVYTRKSLVNSTEQNSTIKIPWRISPSQKAYLTYLQQNTEEAIALGKETASWSIENQYNLWTFLAIQSITSGEVTNLSYLQEAETYLSGAATLDANKNTELTHNLIAVRDLLKKKEKEQQEEQKSDQQNGSWDQQQNQEQQKQPWSTEQQWEEETQWNEWSTSQLSESMKQQLEQYQKQLAEAQEQNQQFFDKPQQAQAQNDPFNALNQLFGGNPQLQQQQENWTKDR